MKRIITFLWLTIISVNTFAASGYDLMSMDVDLSDRLALQKGAKVFVNYCLGCHSANYMRYSRMAEDLGIDEKTLKANFIFDNRKVGDTMTVSLQKEDAEEFFGVAPPDLSVSARSRGADWLYTYLKTFYKDDKRPFGFNNIVFKDVSMPHVLWQLQGVQKLNVSDENHSPSFEDLSILRAGTLSEEEYDETVRNLVNFMVYMAEPIKLKRVKIGYWVMIYLFVFLIFAYLLKKDYWRDVH